jgi:prepilin peptidase CpaA
LITEGKMTFAETAVMAWSLVVGFTDLRVRRIPNALTFGGCLVAITWLLVTGHSMLGVGWRSVLLAALLSQLLTVPAYMAQLLGAGDVKLLLAIALLGGKDFTLLSFVLASFIALIGCVAQRLWARFHVEPTKSGRWFPFGTALGIGLLCAIGIMK